MKLNQLAEQAEVPAPTLKFWIREGLLPRAPLKNARTAVYGKQHLQRAMLIKVLREEFDASLPVIRTLTEAIDSGERTDLVLQRCQSVASAAWTADRSAHRAAGDTEDAPASRYHDTVAALCRRVGWPDESTLARDELAVALEALDRHDVSLSPDDLVGYARALEPIAAVDLDIVTSEDTVDMIAIRTLLGVRAQVAVLVAVNQLAHTSVALTRLRQHLSDRS